MAALGSYDMKPPDDYVDDYIADDDYGDGELDGSFYADEETIPADFIEPSQEVQDFLHEFHRAVTKNDVNDIHYFYDNQFNFLTEKYYSSTAWPLPAYVDKILGEEGYDESRSIFSVLYREMYYRHIHARVQGAPDITQRIKSFFNYTELFNTLIASDAPVSLDLPQQWLWDIIDEFIYQFQMFTLFRCKSAKKPLTPEERMQIDANAACWNIHAVINVLFELVNKSNINKQLEARIKGEDFEGVAGEYGVHPLYRAMGFFSLIGLLRLYVLLGDYHQALKSVEFIDFNRHKLWIEVPACQITTYYYVGFSYMMQRRYQDAIRIFVHVLTYIQRTQHVFHNKQSLFDYVNKQKDQMYNLLSMCLVLYPMRIDESIHQILVEKSSDKRSKLMRGDENEFSQLFHFSSPKFILSDPESGREGNEAMQRQLGVFMQEVHEQLTIFEIRSYLKLYTTLPLTKLANLMDIEDVNDLREKLMCFKRKMSTQVWSESDGADPMGGGFQSGSELDFYIEGDMIHVVDTKVARRYGDFFIRNILKCQEIGTMLRGLRIKAMNYNEDASKREKEQQQEEGIGTSAIGSGGSYYAGREHYRTREGGGSYQSGGKYRKM